MLYTNHYKKLVLAAVGMLTVSEFLVACSLQSNTPGNTPAPEYRLTPQQLAWQPYHVGQVIRFGNNRTSTIRTYAVSQLTDRLVTAYCSVCFSEQPKYQEVRVQIQRTDTPSVKFEALSLQLMRVRASGTDDPVLYATEGWTTHCTPSLPLDKIDSGQPLDSTQYFRVKLLPTLTLGSTTYSQVLRSPDISTGPVVPGVHLIKNLYFTKEKGVVGFDEQVSGRWYRLP